MSATTFPQQHRLAATRARTSTVTMAIAAPFGWAAPAVGVAVLLAMTANPAAAASLSVAS